MKKPDRKKKEVKFMERAIELARSNIHLENGGPFGAVIVKDGEIVGEGANLVTTSNDPTAHAEIVAIRNTCKNLETFNLEGCEIYTSCHPCPMCLGAIYWARIKKIHYAATSKDAHKAYFDDSHIYEEYLIPAQKRKIPSKQLMRMEAVAVFKEWVDSDKKIPY